MTARHTPGPWQAHHGWASDGAPSPEYPDWCEVVGPRVNGQPRSVNGHFGLANARLIAAAPELLEALRRALDAGIGSDSKQPSVADQARAAIAKATGGAA